MLMQDNSNLKQVIWTDAVEGKKLINDDSTNDLIYQDNPQPVVTHKSTPVSKSIMKVVTDPFYAECFPPPAPDEIVE